MQRPQASGFFYSTEEIELSHATSTGLGAASPVPGARVL